MRVKPFQVTTRLPDRIKHLRDLAMNMWFSWNQEALDLFIRLGYNPGRESNINYWEESSQNPMKLISLLPPEVLDEAAKDDSFISDLDRVYEKFQDYFKRQTWFERNVKKRDDFLVAYFSCEFGLDECLPVYSGGLGILSGDHLKSSSDLGIPLIGIGLLYQEGYFQQYLNNDGWQQERYPTNDWYNMSVTRIDEESGDPLTISLELAGDTVTCQIWRVKVGRVPLYLLDTNLPSNSFEHRQITHRLYGGDRDMRIRQEIVLGVGGIKALEAMDIKPSVFHINEGHSAFLAFERIRSYMEKEGMSYKEAWEQVWASNVFTTHTPVPAGNETFSLDLIRKYFHKRAGEMGLSIDQLIEIGQEKPRVTSYFSLTVLALRMAAQCNGVAKLHGDTSRKMWSNLWSDLPLEEIPIQSITNGVHTYTWLSSRMRDLLERYCGPRFREEPEDVGVWNRIDNIPDNELWRVRQSRRERLIAFARRRVGEQLFRRGASPSEVRMADEVLNPQSLTIGFSRRFASYKRATLLFRDLDRLLKLLNNPDRPVQILFAGKAHPQDNPGKELIRRIVKVATDPRFRNSIVFLENYDINIARYMVQGVDIWLNTPRRPLEASGTSGMKAAINGALNVSVLDGWWDEGYGESNGWAIGSGEIYDDPKLQDDIESEALYRLLEKDIVPLFYDRDRAGIPRNWLKMVKSSMKTLGSFFNSHRMLVDYTEQMYCPADWGSKKLSADNYNAARELAKWRDRARREWPQISLAASRIMAEDDNISVNDTVPIEVNVWLGFFKPAEVSVQVYFGPLDSRGRIMQGEVVELSTDQETDGRYVFRGEMNMRFNGRCGYAVRVIPRHEALIHPFTPLLIKWE